MTNKEIVKNYLTQYFDKEKILYNLKRLFTCHFCKCEKESASIQNNRYSCYACQTNVNIFGYIRKINENMKSLNDEEIADYLVDYLDITVDEEVEKILEMYKNNGFALFELSPNSKIPIRESKWRTTGISKDINKWREWLDNGYGLALRLGPESGVMLLEFDDIPTYDKLQNLIEPTLQQTTKRGKGHFYYKYDPAFYKTINKLAKNKGYNLELRVEGAYSVVAPTSVEGEKREWNYAPISEMNWELKEFLLKLYDNTKQEDDTTHNETKDLKDIKLQGLQGCCDDTIISFGGALRKFLPPDKTGQVLYLFNNMLDEPMSKTRIDSKIKQLSRYTDDDRENLKNEIVHRLDIVESATAFQIASTLKKDQKIVEDILKTLLDEEKVLKEGNQYRRTRLPNWRTDFMDIEKESQFPVPIFDDVSFFKDSAMIIIGGVTGTGKTTLVSNFLKWYKDVGIKPYLLSSEKTSGVGEYAAKFGLVEGDFYIYNSKRLQDIELSDNAVTLIDWLRPKDSQYMLMDQIFENLDWQVNKHGGLLFVFTQLRPSNRNWFAPDLIEHNGYLNAKYLHSEIKDNDGKVIGYDRVNTYFEITKMRKPKNKAFPTKFIPMKYDPNTDLITKRDI